jgi:hypothetical protein
MAIWTVYAQKTTSNHEEILVDLCLEVISIRTICSCHMCSTKTILHVKFSVLT